MELVRRLHSIGRRGAFLISKGVLYILYGLGLLIGSDTPPHHVVLHLIVPHDVWAVAWIAVGVVACVAAFVTRLEPIAFSALMGLATIWAVGVLAVYLIAGPQGSTPWIVATIFAAVMASTAIVAGWPEPQ